MGAKDTNISIVHQSELAKGKLQLMGASGKKTPANGSKQHENIRQWEQEPLKRPRLGALTTKTFVKTCAKGSSQNENIC